MGEVVEPVGQGSPEGPVGQEQPGPVPEGRVAEDSVAGRLVLDDGTVLVGRNGEDLRARALRLLAPIEEDRLSRDLLAQGLSPQEVAERVGTEVRFVRGVRQDMERGEEIRPVTPEELVYRRAAGQISTQEMMERLRAWPYTFGRVRGYDGYESGSWDDIIGVQFYGFLSPEEFAELDDIAQSLPQPPEAPYGSAEFWGY
ncbi:hypothetical protein [Actinomyces weissii]|uniref:Uncharacterized protein n=1 Tax=Actinomyces weissii TaxID=675090 RepID=A0A7T7MAB4_9ACTO|nr:hypothetical protein [Actinomyces weissii]QQM67818.1 hypothetical protein JG540_02745 [Actinomyces weissii]